MFETLVKNPPSKFQHSFKYNFILRILFLITLYYMYLHRLYTHLKEAISRDQRHGTTRKILHHEFRTRQLWFDDDHQDERYEGPSPLHELPSISLEIPPTRKRAHAHTPREPSVKQQCVDAFYIPLSISTIGRYFRDAGCWRKGWTRRRNRWPAFHAA